MWRLFGLIGLFICLQASVFIQKDAYNKLHEHVEKGYPYEAIGLIAGRLDSLKGDIYVTDIYPCRNMAQDVGLDPKERSVLSIECFDNANKNLNIIGTFHSHITSETDIAYSSPGLSELDRGYLIRAGLNGRILHIIVARQISGEKWTTSWIVFENLTIYPQPIFIED